MIKVKMISKSNRKLMFDEFDEFFDSIYYETAKNLENDFKNTQCEIHKSESFGTIFINAENGKFSLGEFCCDKFKPNI